MIKKFVTALSLLLALAMIAPSVPVFAAGEADGAVVGDINGDGKVTDWDAIIFQRYLAGWNVELDIDTVDVDMNGDGKINTLDSIIMDRYLAGWYKSADYIAKNALHISKDGNDETGDGSAAAPFATIERAKEKVRQMLADGAEGEIVVYMHEGEYVIGGEYTPIYDNKGNTSYGSYLMFTEEDSGNENCKVTYKAFYDDDVVITTVKNTLTAADFEKADEAFTSQIRDESARDKIYMVDLKKLGYDNINKSDDYFNVFYGDLMMDVARYPDRNFNDKESMYVPFQMPDSEVEKANGYYYVDDSVPFDSWHHMSEMEVRGFISVDYFTGVVRPYKYETGSFSDKDGTVHDGLYRVYISGETPRNNLKHFYHNVPEELNYRGEYYISDDGILYIYADDDFADTTIRITEFTPNSNNNYTLNALGFNNCNYYTFDGITFSGIRGCAIRGRASNLTIQNCIIKDVPDSGLDISGDNVIVRDNEIYNVGGEGVILFGDTSASATLKSCGNIIENNVIHDFELVTMCYNPAIYYTGNGTIIRHNEVYNGSHAAVQGGGADVVFEYNYLHDVCFQGGDAGAMYIGGFDAPMLIRYNIFDNVVNHIGGGAPSAIYVDDGGTGKTIYGNIINCSGGVGIKIGGGSENVVQNNILVGTKISYDGRGYFGDWQDIHGVYGKDYGGWYWKHILGAQTDAWDYRLWNIRYPYYYQLKSSNVKDYTDHYLVGVCGGGVVQNNVCVWENPQLATGVAGVGKAQPSDCSQALHLNGVYKDVVAYLTIDEVGFVDYENGDLRLREDSKVYTDIPGFKDIPVEMIGIIK